MLKVYKHFHDFVSKSATPEISLLEDMVKLFFTKHPYPTFMLINDEIYTLVSTVGGESMVKKMMNTVGPWSFIAGIVIAVLVGLVVVFGGAIPNWAPVLLAVLGLIVGFMNVTGGEARGFLIAAVAFLLSFNSLSGIASLLGTATGEGFGAFFSLMGVFVAPAAAIVAFKELFGYTKD